MLKKLNFFAFLFLFTFLLSCSQTETKRQLIVAMNPDTPGYFTVGGNTFGYQYDLITEYARSLGYELCVVSENSPQECRKLLSSGDIDMIAALQADPYEHAIPIVQIYKTSYVVLTNRKTAGNIKEAGDIGTLFDDRQVMISHGFSSSKSYDRLLDSAKNCRVFISSANTFELLEALSRNKFDYLICEKSEGYLGCKYVRNVEQIYEFEDDIPVYIQFGKKDRTMAQNFSRWLDEFELSQKGTELRRSYFDKSAANQITTHDVREKQNGRISAYDDMIKQIAGRENIDWRLVSAIAYHESRFNPLIVSRQGAQGLMQIMPSVAREFNFHADSIMNPESNILLGVKLINKLQQLLKFGAAADFENRMCIILACYNGGIGHISDARKLAAKYGANPDSWSDVSYYLGLKSQQEFADDEVVKSGTFNGIDETVGFVSKVMKKYNSYCLAVAN